MSGKMFRALFVQDPRQGRDAFIRFRAGLISAILVSFYTGSSAGSELPPLPTSLSSAQLVEDACIAGFRATLAIYHQPSWTPSQLFSFLHSREEELLLEICEIGQIVKAIEAEHDESWLVACELHRDAEVPCPRMLRELQAYRAYE